MSEEEQWAKINIDRKRSSYIEKDCFDKSQNHRSTDDRTAELNIHLEDRGSTKTVQHELHKSNIYGTAAIVNNGVTTIKPGHQTTGNARVIWSDESSFMLFPTSGRVYIWRTPREVYNPECLIPTVKHSGRFYDGLSSNIVVQHSVGPIITLNGRITLREYMDRLGNQAYPMIQTLFPNNYAVFQIDNADSQSWNCSVMA
jgi:hypothetical protein